MHAPRLSPALWRLPLLIALACVGLCQCSHPASTSATGQTVPRVEWYIASRDPLTYCPKGHALPRRGSREDAQAEYITLPGHPSRYYIPPGCEAHRKQALEQRHRIASRKPGFCGSACETFASWISRAGEVVVNVFCFPMWVRLKIAEAEREEERCREEKRRLKELERQKRSGAPPRSPP